MISTSRSVHHAIRGVNALACARGSRSTPSTMDWAPSTAVIGRIPRRSSSRLSTRRSPCPGCATRTCSEAALSRPTFARAPGSSPRPSRLRRHRCSCATGASPCRSAPTASLRRKACRGLPTNSATAASTITAACLGRDTLTRGRVVMRDSARTTSRSSTTTRPRRPSSDAGPSRATLAPRARRRSSSSPRATRMT